MLEGAVGDHHVADAQGRVEPAGHAREHDQPAAEPVGQQRRHQGRVDLADPGADQHHLVAVEAAQVEAGMRHTDRLGVLERVAQMAELLGMAQIRPMVTGGSSRRRAAQSYAACRRGASAGICAAATEGRDGPWTPSSSASTT